MDVSGLGEVDEPAFSGLAERHRRELHVHCYRMLGSFEDAEDTVQETFLRAWRRRETFEGRSTFRAWLYRIATNACLDLLAKRRPEPATGGEVPWLQPYPDRLLDELPAGDADEPETVAVARETIELAYLVARPAPRAAPAGRADPARRARLAGEGRRGPARGLRQLREQRAAAGPRRHAGAPARASGRTGPAARRTPATRELVRRFTDASVATDIDAAGRDAARRRPLLDAAHAGPVRRSRRGGGTTGSRDGFEGMQGLRGVPTSVNRQPAVAFYLWQEREQAPTCPLTLDVLRVSGRRRSPRSSPSTTTGSPASGCRSASPADGAE